MSILVLRARLLLEESPCAVNGTSSDWRKLPKMLDSAEWRPVSSLLWIWTEFDIRSKSRPTVLYEASVLGLCAFRKHELEPGGLTQLEVEVRSSVKHTLTVTKVREWLRRGVRTPKEAILKDKLRTLLSS